MKILITGGAGFIGSAVVRLAIARGHHVVNLDALKRLGAVHLVKGTARFAKRASERSVEQRIKSSIWFSVSLVRLRIIEAKKDELFVVSSD